MKYTVRFIDTSSYEIYEIEVIAEDDFEAKEKAWDKFLALPQIEKDRLFSDGDGEAEIIHKEADE